jgi:hypothetical protein
LRTTPPCGCPSRYRDTALGPPSGNRCVQALILRGRPDVTVNLWAAAFMTVVLLDHDAGGETKQRAVVRKDADDVGAAADLAVDALERVGRAQLGPVVAREGVEGQEVLLGLLEQRRDLRQRPSQPLERRADERPRLAASSALKIGRRSAAGIGCCSRRACPSASRRKWAEERCQGQPSTWAIARFKPAWQSETTSSTPVRPRSTSERRNERQKASVSHSPTSSAITSR